MKLLGISGSLRKGSYNTGLLEAAARLLPQGVELTIVGCGDIPLYNKDLDAEKKPEAVLQLLQEVRYADGVLFATPEYNYSFSGVLKNAIDWASRPAYKSVLAGKPAAIISASGGPVGGARAQAHLCQVLSATLSPVVPAPSFLVPMAQDKFDKNGLLTDEDTKRRLARYIGDFVLWVNRLAGRPEINRN
jgi:chromate reductase, NAD(P)H dehydrogenase (quinone)